jgi:hypothetical protein
MAGERYASITIQVALSHDIVVRGAQTQSVNFVLGGKTLSFGRGGGPSEFVVPDPSDPSVGEQYVMQCVQNLLSRLGPAIALSFGGLPFRVSFPRAAGTKPDPYNSTAMPVVEFDIIATTYSADNTLSFSTGYLYEPGFFVTNQVLNVTPVVATADVTNATIFGAADGAITINASGGSTPAPGSFLYLWSDGAYDRVRKGLKKGTYPVTVRDLSSLASVTLNLTVDSDTELVVVVATTDTTIKLTPSGGVPGYNFQWDDGPTVASRIGLTLGTYGCVVTDSHGATKRIEVTLSAYQYKWSQNPITLALDAGADYRLDPTIKPNLSFLCEVWVELDYLSGDFVQIGTTLEQPADRDGRTVFQVQTLLAAFLQHHVPAPASPAIVRADSLFRRYFLRHAEQYGAVPVAQPSFSLERNYVVLGGLNFYEAQQRTWFDTYQPRVLPFLTWEPTAKAVLDDQPEFLYFMVRKDPGAFRMHARVHFSDGSEQLIEPPDQLGVRDFEVYCLPVGYQALGLNKLTKEVSWWEVFVTTPDSTVLLSETRRFVRERRVFPKRRYFLFATSLGGMATYAALGEAQTDVEVTGTEATLAPTPTYDPQLGDVAVQDRALRPVVKIAAGKRTQQQLLASQDLLLSKRVLMLAGQRWLPGFIKAKNAPLLDESKLVQVQEFEFYQTTERLYTPAL